MASDRVGEMKGRVGEVEHLLGEGDDDSGSMEFTRPSEGRARTCGSLIGLGLAHGEGDGESIVDFHEGLLLDPVDDVGDCLGEDMPVLARSYVCVRVVAVGKGFVATTGRSSWAVRLVTT